MNNRHPAITVITPVYNAAAFLEETIDSVLGQTFTGFEYLLPDDSSADNSADIVRKYKDMRITYIPCTHDFIETQNRGFGLARSKYIAQLDHDDIMMPARLEIQYRFMEENPDIAACGGYMQVFGKEERLWTNPLKHEEIIENMISPNPVHNSTVFYRREFLTARHIKMEKGYSYTSDYKIITEIAKTGRIENLPVVFTRSSDRQASVLFEREMKIAGLRIHYEMIDYFISQLDCRKRYMKIAKQKLIPALDMLRRSECISESIYYVFMYELVTGLGKLIKDKAQ